jgi:hypothetical protein
MRRALIGLEEPMLLPPPKPKPPEEPDEVDDEDKWAIHEMERALHDADVEVWKEEVKLEARRRMEQKINILPSVYAVVWRQCTSDMQELLRSTDVFQAIDESNDVIALLKLIRPSTVMDQRSQHPALNALQALNKFTSFRQMNMTNDVYLEGFRDRVDIYEEVTGQMLGCDTKRVEEEFGGSIDNVETNNPNLVAAKKICRDKFLAVAFIEHADKKRYARCNSSSTTLYRLFLTIYRPVCRTTT